MTRTVKVFATALAVAYAASLGTVATQSRSLRVCGDPDLTAYSVLFDPGGDRDRPAKLLDDLIAGTVDVAMPWGPLAGSYVKKLNAQLELTPLADETGVPLSYGLSMGVKKGNRDLKNALEMAMDGRQPEIRTVLEEYGVPFAGARAGSNVAARQENQTPAPQNPPAPQDPSAEPKPQDGAAPQTGIKKLNPFTGKEDAIATGKVLYIQVGCQGCHGGGGGGGMAASLIDDNWKFGSDDEVLFKLIKGQIPEQTMPVVYSALPDDQVWQMLAFIRTLYKGDPSKINW